MGLIDSHAHLTSATVWPRIDKVLASAKAAGLERIVNICTDRQSLELGLQLAKEHPWIGTVAATTPHDVEKEAADFFPIVETAAKKRELIAIGETGLDYHYEHSPRELQRQALEQYLALAVREKLPIVIHCRDAFDDLFSIADACYAQKPLLLHCFTGTVVETEKALARGWKISFSGIITFKKSESLREAVKNVPLSEILIETDTPYLAPQSKRGQENEPAFLRETAECVAAVKRLDLQEVIETTCGNALQFFSWSKRV